MAQAQSASAAEEPAAPGGVWARLADRLNPAFEYPKVRDGIEARLLTTSRGIEYYICKNPRTGTYVRLAPDEYYLLGLMDGTRQVKDLVLAYFLQYKSFAFQRIAHVVAELRQHQFLVEEPRDAWAGLNRHFLKRTFAYKLDQMIGSFRYHEFPLTGIDGTITALYRLFGWIFFTKPMVVLWLVLSTVLAAFAEEVFWAGITSVTRGQWLAARSTGLTALQTLAYVVLPQAVRLAIPPLTNRTIAITKNTALGSAIGVSEILGRATSAQAFSGNATPLTIGALLYLAIFLPLVVASRSLERRYGWRRA